MANTNTKISTKLKEFTETVATEQMKQVEEAIKEQNDAIERLFQRFEDAISSINKQKHSPQRGYQRKNSRRPSTNMFLTSSANL